MALTPVIVRGSDGLEFDGHDVAGRDEAFRGRRVIRSATAENIEIGLNVMDRVPRDVECQGGPSDVVVGAGGLVSGRAPFYVAISVAVLWEVLWVS
jgi:hypothetical protein